MWMRRTRKFQFHYGTIEGHGFFSFKCNLLHFNSTMVRLRADIENGTILDYINFNSTMVRLRVAEAGEGDFEYLDFNSTMVRLRVYRPELLIDTISHFNSTMVRLRVPGRRTVRKRQQISIPLWYD